MKPRLFPAALLGSACLLIVSLVAAQTTTKLRMLNGYLLVPVFINGSGPYDFVLDTGSNRTLVKGQILNDLGIFAKESIRVHMANGVAELHRAVTDRVTVAGLGVNGFEVEVLEPTQIAALGVPIQGLLGEDYLKHFDILLDNHAKTLTLDNSSSLVRSTVGEHLALSLFGRFDDLPTSDRLVVDLKLPIESRPLHVLLDSGIQYGILYVPKPLSSSAGGGTRTTTLRTLSGDSQCQFNLVVGLVGGAIPADFGAAFCDGLKREQVDVDGALPTNIFGRLFISHSLAYAIVNPRIHKQLAHLAIQAGGLR